jgi:hypothetical protein
VGKVNRNVRQSREARADVTANQKEKCMLAKTWKKLLVATALALCAAGQSIAQAPTKVMTTQSVPVVRPAVSAPVQGKSAAPAQRLQSLENPPPAEFFIDPGLEGIYARLRKAEPASATELAPYTPYENRQTTADKSKFNLRQIVVKFVEGAKAPGASRSRAGQCHQRHCVLRKIRSKRRRHDRSRSAADR